MKGGSPGESEDAGGRDPEPQGTPYRSHARVFRDLARGSAPRDRLHKSPAEGRAQGAATWAQWMLLVRGWGGRRCPTQLHFCALPGPSAGGRLPRGQRAQVCCPGGQE